MDCEGIDRSIDHWVFRRKIKNKLIELRILLYFFSFLRNKMVVKIKVKIKEEKINIM